MIEEIRRTFLTYKKQSNIDISRLILTGAESILTNEAQLLKKEFNLPTTYVNPIRAWPMAEGAKLPPGETIKKVSFAAALALAFSFDELEVNLLPAGIQERRIAKVTKEAIYITGLLFLSLLLVGGGMVWKKEGSDIMGMS